MTRGEVELILVGNELLKGQKRDAHLAYVGRLVSTAGVRVESALVIGDDRDRIAAVVRERAAHARVLIVAGGLGPTHDDVTREGVADGLGLAIEFRESEWKRIEAMFTDMGRKADESNRRQAYFPQGSRSIANRRGTAAGFVAETAECLVAVLPGPPRELVPMMRETVLPYIQRIYGRASLYQETFRTAGIGESDMTPLVGPIFDRFVEFEISSLPYLGGVDIVLTEKTPGGDAALVRRRALEFESELRAALGHRFFGKGDETLEAVIGNELSRRRETLAVAESLTGGLIGKRLTDVAGSSRYLLADVVAYSNASKTTLLDVGAESIDSRGAVSEDVCRGMADGARRRTGATYGLATTGIAGPTGGTAEKPIGLTYYGMTWEGGADIRRRVFPGDREDVRERAAHAVLFLLYTRLADTGGRDGAHGPKRRGR
jgi:nicotinamide-nucleotide amidase